MSYPATTSEPLRPRGPVAEARYAARLLLSLGFEAAPEDEKADEANSSADLSWAASGAMALTGAAHEPPQLAPAPIATCAAGAALALRTLATATTGRAPADLDGAALLGERAALTEPSLSRQGRISPGGSARLVACADGWLALNLSREDDRTLLPAWLEVGADTESEDAAWRVVEAEAREHGCAELVARGREMGMAVSPARTDGPRETSWYRLRQLTPPRTLEQALETAPKRPPLVVDLSSLWAGPLCGQLLGRCGARVVKVESLERPDGARAGDARFFDLMNGEKESVALPFRSPRGIRALRALLETADVVIEASRPRALLQLGIDPDAIAAENGTTWVSITGHGREAPAGDWVAFGDDAAAAGGLLVQLADGSPGFCGDAIADPLTGIHAAVAALAGVAGGGGRLIDVALSGVAGWVRAQPFHGPRLEIAPGKVAPPRARPAPGPAPALGADTSRVLGALGIPC